jgi:hypothetical protein
MMEGTVVWVALLVGVPQALVAVDSATAPTPVLSTKTEALVKQP